MTNEELYDLMKRGFDQMQSQFLDIKTEMRQGFESINHRIDGIDTRLRNVENDVAELKGRRLAFKEWIPIGCSVVAVIVSIFALLKA